ncbi:hypothetical protein [Arthrobacter sp. GMC3]|nr:hypothetical protein [Arthrobacter sp. GMC3]
MAPYWSWELPAAWAGNSSDGVMARHQIAPVLVGSLASDAAEPETRAP